MNARESRTGREVRPGDRAAGLISRSLLPAAVALPSQEEPTIADVSPAIVAQLSEEPEERFWFLVGPGNGCPAVIDVCGKYRLARAFAFESDAECHSRRLAHEMPGLKPVYRSVRQILARQRVPRGIGLYDRDLNLIRRLA